MLKEISHYHNFGTPNYFYQLAILIDKSNEDTWDKLKIQRFFYNRGIDGQKIFDGCIEFSILVKLVEENSEGEITLNKAFEKNLNDFDAFTSQLIGCIFSYLQNDELTFEIFSSDNLSYDLMRKSLKVTNKAFKFKYKQFKQLLIDFEILEYFESEMSRTYLISNKYINFFKTNIISENKRRGLTPDELQSILALKAKYGEEAEKFVLSYEGIRLGGGKDVKWVAELSVSEGYDIASYNTELSELYDRFIEVKSYSGKPAFYWSRNEINTAKSKKRSYFLYLVNRDEFTKPNYSPLIIENPSQEIFNDSGWLAETESYHITRP